MAFVTPQAQKAFIKGQFFLTIFGMRAVHGKPRSKG